MYNIGEHYVGNVENMEVLFYEQSAYQGGGAFASRNKTSMRLNLEPQQENFRPNARPSGGYENAAELGFLKMVSPELEKFIASNTGLTPKGNPTALKSPELTLFNLVSPEFEKVLASVQGTAKTPTPTKVLREGNSINQQREAYVQGFAQALQQLQERQIAEQPVYRPSGAPVVAASCGWGDLTPDETSQYNCQVNAQNDKQFEMNGTSYQEANQERSDLNAVGPEPETFDCEDSVKVRSVPLLPPIDLELQEIVKRERKKQKNRVAASKCRKKKLEREAQLEVRVQALKDKNIELNAVANALRQQVTELKQRVLEHVAFGCQLPSVTTSYWVPLVTNFIE